MFVLQLSIHIYADESDFLDVKVMKQYLNSNWMKLEGKSCDDFEPRFHMISWIVLVL